jgi:hypothetical protein
VGLSHACLKLLTQIKKELTITGSSVDKMSNKELFTLFYSCIFTRNEIAPKKLCKILLTR